jgi:hypothetical protein
VYFGGTYCLNLEDRRVKQASNRQDASSFHQHSNLKANSERVCFDFVVTLFFAPVNLIFIKSHISLKYNCNYTRIYKSKSISKLQMDIEFKQIRVLI